MVDGRGRAPRVPPRRVAQRLPHTVDSRVSTGSWTGPPQGKRAPRVGPVSIVILVNELSQIGSSAMAPLAFTLRL